MKQTLRGMHTPHRGRRQSMRAEAGGFSILLSCGVDEIEDYADGIKMASGFHRGNIFVP